MLYKIKKKSFIIQINNLLKFLNFDIFDIDDSNTR